MLHGVKLGGFLFKGGCEELIDKKDTLIKNTSSLKLWAYVSKSQLGACLEEGLPFFQVYEVAEACCQCLYFSKQSNFSVDGEKNAHSAVSLISSL